MDSLTAVSVIKQSTIRRLSRYGCRNCKLRKLKCDETRPNCERCRAYGVACNFGYNVPDLQPLRQGQVTHELARQFQAKLEPPRALVSNAVWSLNKLSYLNLEKQDQELFFQFRRRTVYSLGGSELVYTYENKIYRDSFTCPALMHGILAMAAVHDRYLAVQSTRHRSMREVYHSSRCVILFSKWLSQPIEEEDKDAIWATAVTLAILTFSCIDVSSFEQAWPLKRPDPSDLQWLRLKASDKAIWQLANPMRPSSVFRKVPDTFSQIPEKLPIGGIDGVSVELAKLCGLDGSSTPENNTYFGFVHSLSRLLEVPKGEASLGKTFMVVSVISDELRACLEEKDPVALFLLYLWYSRALEIRWWIDIRARYELPAIRKYLQLHHKDIGIIQALLLEEP